MLPQGCLCWLSPVLPSGAGSSGAVEALCCAPVPAPSPRPMQLMWLKCLCSKWCFTRTGVDSRSTTGFHLLLHAPPPDLLPRLFGGSPGSDLTVTTTFISCSLGKWCKGKYFLHPLHITYQGNCWINFLVFAFWCMQPLQYYALFSTLSLQNGRCKNFSNIDLPCSNHKLIVCETCAETYSVECLRLHLSSCLTYETCIKKV